ncbi:MAG: molybdate ABC transporter substrate-binding protein [Methanobacterium paludis]|uniref:Molybdenum ABC transporter, periplasmic molybdate-binding protein n=1 Tax=Methanobacterium paludis (strain DSM 25820 / JCM 18151 / SWAN1) TaxID=868131 RepID=F6D837_METPW|nr:molybdate ABC transporter substrate-binding protein [Methanobacterium paludis]AEG17182.1 molybdenum ABC transporter, periplasmic molybdate-binding protein [Methanobacterium paludis]MCE7699191.1 molybdate ABC transporter substrate-binding protein [Methanobacterium paludis]
MDSKQVAVIAIILILVVVAGLYASGLLTGGNSAQGNITVLAGAGTMSAMNELKTSFEKQNPGTTVNIQYGNSGELFAALQTQKTADVIVPGDLTFMDNAKNKGYIINDTVKPIVYHIPVIAVQKGNPKNITSVTDLGKSGIKVALGDTNATAVGKESIKLLNKTGELTAVQSNVVVYAPTVNQLLTYLTSGQVDAAIVTEDIANTSAAQGKIDVIQIPQDQNAIATIGVGLTSFTQNKDAATKFENYITSSEGLSIWEKHGFKPVNQ